MNTTPRDNHTEPTRPTDQTQRTKAYILDAITLLVIFVLTTVAAVALIMWEVENHAEANGGDASMSGVLLVFLPLVWALLGTLYQVVLPMVWHGQTVGSKLAKIKTVDGARWTGNVWVPLLLVALTVVLSTAGSILWLIVTIN